MGTSRDPHIDVWHVLIAGFTQRIGQPTGMHSLWLRINQLFSGPEVQCELHPWHACWDEIAENIKISRSPSPPTILVYAYSWGAGWGFIKLAQALEERGLVVRAAVLCDPVYRSRWLSMSWRSLVTCGCLRPTIPVPANVRWVRWLYQRNGLPAGHRPVAVHPRATHIDQGIEVPGVVHNSMDELDEFHELALDTAGRMGIR